MDEVTESIANFAAGFELDQVPEPVVAIMVDHIIDAVGCALGSLEEAPAEIGRRLAASTPVPSGGASVIGLPQTVAPEQAAFANAVMVRCLDYNDTFQSVTGGHPSDMLAGILAAAELADLSGGDVVKGIFVAYETFGALADRVPLRELGIDQGVFTAVACAAGIASMRRMTPQQAGNAVSLAVTSSMPLRVARGGELSEWKGCATAHATMNAVFVTRLAALGMSGPPSPFAGIDGFFARAAGPFQLPQIGQPVDGRFVVERTGIKFRPVEWGAQAPVELFLDLRDRVVIEEIESINIRAYPFLVNEIGGGRGDAAAKWDPQTRETADHSLPYLLAVALVDGQVTLDSFRPERFLDPALRPLMAKMNVEVAPESRELPPTRQPVEVRIKLQNGTEIIETCEYPVGHPMNPGSSADIEAKFRVMTEDPAIASTAAQILQRLRGLPSADNVRNLAKAFRAVPLAERSD